MLLNAAQLEAEATDEDRVAPRQIIVNLIGNAVKFTFEGEVVMHVEKQSQENGQVCLHFAIIDTEWAARLQRHLDRYHIHSVVVCTKPLRDYGDFSWYWIRDVNGILIQRLNELFAMNAQVGFIVFHRTDGKLVNTAAVKHLANAEMRIVLHNALHADDTRRANFPVLPAAVFADPQVATAGPTERELRRQEKAFVVARRDYADTGYGWALEDTTSFVKLIADPATRRLLAAHIIGPQAATLIQPLVQAIYLDNTVEQLAHDVLYIHPAASEVISQALLELPHPPA